MRIVIDASALFEILLRGEFAPQIRASIQPAQADLHIPELADIEIASALRSAFFAAALPAARLDEALSDYIDLKLIRHRHKPLLGRVLALRNNFSAYDATYVALAEMLGATLLTADAALSRAVRRHLTLPVFP